MIDIYSRESEQEIIRLIAQPELKTSYEQVKNAVESIWEEVRIIKGFTDHGIGHSYRVLQRAAEILKAGISYPLSEYEAYALLLGIFLHDIGMQCDVANRTIIKTIAEDFGARFNVEFSASDADSYSHKEQDSIRENHHYITAAWIDYCWKHIDDTSLALAVKSIPKEIIADVMDICKYHSKLFIERCPEQFHIYHKERKQLVAAILRLADELDIDAHRVNFETVKNFRRTPKDEMYWWLHDRTYINFRKPHLLSIEVHLSPEDLEHYGDQIKTAYLEPFRKKNEQVLGILAANNLPIVIDPASNLVSNEYDPPLVNNIIEALQRLNGNLSENECLVGDRDVPDFADNKQANLSSLLEELTVSIAASEKIDRAEVVRLYSIAAAQVYNSYTSGILGNHEANLVYKHLDTISLSAPEKYLIFRSILSDSYDAIPGWRSINDTYTIRHSVYAADYAKRFDSSPSVRKGALRFLDAVLGKEGIEFFREALDDEDQSVQELAAKLIADHGDEDDIELLKRKTDAAPPFDNAFRKQELSLLAKISQEQLLELLNSSSDSLAWEILASVDATRIPDDVLLDKIDSTSPRLSTFCARELLKRRAYLNKLSEIKTTNDELKGIVLKARIESDPAIDLEELKAMLASIKKPGDTHMLNTLDTDSILEYFWSKQPIPLLEANLDWLSQDGPIIYKVLASEHFETMKERLKADLANQFEGLRLDSMRKHAQSIIAKSNLEEQIDEQMLLHVQKEFESTISPNVNDYIKGKYIDAAMVAIANHGDSNFAPIVRELLKQENWQTKRNAFRALCKVGDSTDITKFIEYASRAYGYDRHSAMEAALRETTDIEGTVRLFIEAGVVENINYGLRRLAEVNPEAVKNLSQDLLGNDHDNLRILALAYLVTSCEADELERVLSQQLSQRCYYNVICWLDRILYAPEPLPVLYRRHLIRLADL